MPNKSAKKLQRVTAKKVMKKRYLKPVKKTQKSSK